MTLTCLNCLNVLEDSTFVALAREAQLEASKERDAWAIAQEERRSEEEELQRRRSRLEKERKQEVM